MNNEKSEIDSLKAQVEALKSTLDSVNEKCSVLVDKVKQEEFEAMWKGPLIPLEAFDSSGWTQEERYEMRKKAEAIDPKEHERCALCGAEVFVGASWMWNGMKGGTKPYLARCSKGGCKNVRPFLQGDTPEEAVQRWDERQRAIKAELNRR